MENVTQTASAESSPATGEEGNPLSSLTDQEYQSYRVTGNLPAPKKAASETAKPSEAPKETKHTDINEDDDDGDDHDDLGDDDDADDKPDPATGKPKESRSPKTEARVNKLLAQRAREKARADKAESELAALRTPKPATETKTAKLTEPTEPNPDDYDGTEGKTWKEFNKAQMKYARDLAAYETAKAVNELTEKQAKDRQAESVEAQNKAIKDSWNAKRIAATKAHSDYKEQVGDASHIPINATADGFMLESEQGAEILYWLATNLAEAERIAGLDSYKTAREMVKLEQQFSAPPKADDKKISNAGEPPHEVSGRHTVAKDAVQAAIEKNDVAAYIKEQNARDVASGKVHR